METKELQAIVNPIYTTAKGTVLMLKGGGDPDATKLAPYLDLSDLQKRATTTPQELKRCYVVSQEARYGINNEAALRSGKPVVVDLPCGYSPRGFRVTAAGKRYFGFDLPIVIDEMKEASKKAMSEQQWAASTFAAVDATNYESLRNALGDVKGELCIITEGLLGYFSESELVSMSRAVHRLLAEFGGCWITADSGILEIYGLTFGALFQSDQKAFLERIKGHATRMADAEFYQNSLFLNGPDGAKAFLKSQGFDVKAESVSAYLPEMRTVSGEEHQKLENAYRKMEIWTMTVNQAGMKTEKPIDLNLPFEVKSELTDGLFTVSVQGRMDTITTPELLKQFREAGEGIEAICVDVSRMPYVSSAGLRVLLMMYKSLADKDKFEMTGVSEDVREILETTGFDQFLLKE